jgi:rubrerythrin
MVEWECDCCGHIWEEEDGYTPEQCPNCTGCDKVPHLHDNEPKIKP